MRVLVTTNVPSDSAAILIRYAGVCAALPAPPLPPGPGGGAVSTPATGFAVNYINVVAPDAAVGQITLNGTAIAAALFQPIEQGRPMRQQRILIHFRLLELIWTPTADCTRFVSRFDTVTRVCETYLSSNSVLVTGMYQLDEIDRRIVRELQRDASLSHAALAERVGASAASVWRRVRNLEKENVLGATVRLANAELLGRSVNVLCQVRMARQSVEARAEFEQFIQSRAEIVECYSMSGEWDYLLRIAVRDVADYDRFIMRGVLAHASVANAASNFALRQVKYTTEIPV